MQNFLQSYFLEYSNKIIENKTYYFSNGNLDFYKIFSLLASINSNRDAVILVKNDIIANDIYELSKAFNYQNVYYLPSMQIDAYQNISPKKSILNERINTINNLHTNSNGSKILIVSINAFMQKIIQPNNLVNTNLHIKVGDTIEDGHMQNFLIKNQYKRVSSVYENGCFSLRGDIIDIGFGDKCYRVDFLDNIIERIRIFDPITQKSTNEISEFSLGLVCEIILNKDTINNFTYNYKNNFNHINQEWIELLNNGIYPKGIENYLPLFFNDTNSIVKYLNNPLILDFNNMDDYENMLNEYQEKYNYIMETKNSFNATDNFYILPPQDLLLKIDELNEIFNNTNHIFFNSSNALKIQGEDIKITLAMDKILILKKSIGNIYDVLIAYFKEYLNYKIIVFYNREEFRDRLLNKIKLTNDVNIDNIFFIKSNAINNGFIFKDCIFLNEEEVTGVKQTFIKEKKHNNILNTLGTFNISDILVHKKHGFGIYQGLKTLRVNNIDHDFLEIQYKDNEKLYLPVENMDLLSRYSSFSEEVVLDKLGSYAFENKQKKIKEKIKDIAYDLIKLSANRKLKESVVLDFDAQDYENFCNDFPYIETQDQLNAIGDILQDFSLNSPTDRLICGDVGFGKTEVAMRAAFLIANSGYQVIVVTPTTLLCNQHYINFKERFKNVPVKISQLSRFVTNTQKKQIKEDLANGSIDILISTHGVLAKDVKLKKLGLIIVDEEQNFGVVHKEKLKILDEKAHLLTLSATPIPRTIQQAFKGIKELSLINTPPINKLSINTYILPFDLLSIKLAIDKELQRDGQVFIVCPRIKDIQEIQTDLYKVYNNKIKLVIAHGQMPTKNLEDAMIDFQNKKYDVMISTSIIESGLDLKNVNTIIINNSDMFGLAQLYQIRGRVGRSNIQSYAYLLYKNQKSLTPNAEKRLNILQNLDYLGASFALASYDLEIRGAGNLLGEEQSGHIKDIGYDLYQKLLEEELNHIKNNSSTQNEYAFFSPSININAPVLIPKNYISDMEASIQMYQKLSQINDIKQIEDVKNEMIDRFGVLPKQVINLFETIELKILSQKALVDKITFGNRGILYEFYNKTFPKVDELLNYITSSNDGLILKPNGMVLPINEDDEEYDKIKKCKNVLYNLHKILYN